jgi:hypothetical protein
MKLRGKIERLGLERVAVLALAMGLATMAVDAGIAHFAGRGMKHPGQLAPVIFGAAAVPLAMVAIRGSKEWFRRVVRAVAALGAGVGLVGTAFHAAALMRMVTASGTFDADIVGIALAVAPPLLAPGAFAAIGFALWGLASPRLVMSLRRPEMAAAAA